MLLIAAALWGFAFLFQKSAMSHVGPLTFIGARGVLASLALAPLVCWEARRSAPTGGGALLRRSLAGGLALIKTNVDWVQTLGDVVDLINSSTAGVQARINDRGDGIVVIDTAGGSGGLEIADSGSGTTALDLGIRGSGVEKEIEGVTKTVIEGSSKFTVAIAVSAMIIVTVSSSSSETTRSLSDSFPANNV